MMEQMDPVREAVAIVESNKNLILQLEKEIEALVKENKMLRLERDEFDARKNESLELRIKMLIQERDNWKASSERAVKQNSDIIATFKEFKRKMGGFY